MANGLQQLGLGLQGLSAGLGGRGIEFQKQLRQTREDDRLNKERKAKATEDRLKTQFTDSAAGLELGQQQNWAGILQLATNRLGQLQTNFPDVDSKDTELIVNLATLAADGNAEAQENLMATLKNTVQIGIADKILPKPEVKRIKSGDLTDSGQELTVDPVTQRVIARDVEGFRVKPEEKKDQQPQVNALRKDIFNVAKPFRLVDAAFKRIQGSGKKGTAASDISLIFNFMKMNDPGSTVREGEFATAQNAAGVPQRALSLYNNLLSGTRLSPDQRADFVGQAQTLFTAQELSTDAQIENILQQADQDAIGRERVFGSKRLKDFNTRKAANVTFLGFE